MKEKLKQIVLNTTLLTCLYSPIQAQHSSIFGDSLIHLIKHPQKVEAFRLAVTPKNETVEDTTKDALHQYKVAQKHAYLTKIGADSVAKVLLNMENYASHDYLPQCPLNPDLAFRFIGEDNQFVTLLIHTLTDGCAAMHVYSQNGVKPVQARMLKKRLVFLQLGGELFPPSNHAPTNEPLGAAIDPSLIGYRHDSVALQVYETQKEDKMETLCKKFGMTKEQFKHFNPSFKKNEKY